MTDLSLFFAGTAGSVPSARRGLPAILVHRGGERLLFDCGEGTQRQLLRSVGLADIDAVFITHFHTDHWLGLPGLLKTLDLRARERPLTIHGPRGLRELLRRAAALFGRTGYELRIVEVEPWEDLQRDGYAVASFPVQHRGAALGYALIERDRPGRFDAARARELGVAEGPDFGRLQRGEAVGGVEPEQVVGPARRGRRVVYSGDTTPCDAVAAVAHEADVLVHEATFASDERERALETRHSTAAGAAEVAQRAAVRLLVLNHISTRYLGRELRDEAREVFAATDVARDFDTIEIPFPERGEPRLLHWAQVRERREAARAEAAAGEGSAAPEREAPAR